jgi:hypothetical protein
MTIHSFEIHPRPPFRGNGTFGGDASSVAAQLSSGVVSVFSDKKSFCALKNDTSAICWGYLNGYDAAYTTSSTISAKLASGVTHIVTNPGAYAILRDDGSVATFGTYVLQLRNVAAPADNLPLTCALPFQTVCAGYDYDGGDSSSVAADLAANVVAVYSNNYAFGAVKSSGAFVTWGPPVYGGNSSSLASVKLCTGLE